MLDLFHPPPGFRSAYLSSLFSHSCSASSTPKSPTFWSPTLRQCRNLQTAVSPLVTSSYLPTSYITQKQIETPTSPVKFPPLEPFSYLLWMQLNQPRERWFLCRKKKGHQCRKVWELFKNSPWWCHLLICILLLSGSPKESNLLKVVHWFLSSHIHSFRPLSWACIYFGRHC